MRSNGDSIFALALPHSKWSVTADSFPRPRFFWARGRIPELFFLWSRQQSWCTRGIPGGGGDSSSRVKQIRFVFKEPSVLVPTLHWASSPSPHRPILLPKDPRSVSTQPGHLLWAPALLLPAYQHLPSAPWVNRAWLSLYLPSAKPSLTEDKISL